jgi:hypothetical protein
MYRDHDVTPDKDAVYETIETRQGELKRMLELNGTPLTGAAADAELQRMRNYVHDPSAQAKRRRAGAHDDAQATEMLKMLPDAFIWTRVSETDELVTLAFRPNPNFHPPDMQSRVMGTMAGQMIIVKKGNRIRTLKGKLVDDVKIGYGILGRLDKGGSFDIERHELAPGVWQIAETHVHIGGRALLFKTIGTQEDEVKTEWKPSPAPTLAEAAKVLEADPSSWAAAAHQP